MASEREKAPVADCIDCASRDESDGHYSQAILEEPSPSTTTLCFKSETEDSNNEENLYGMYTFLIKKKMGGFSIRQ